MVKQSNEISPTTYGILFFLFLILGIGAIIFAWWFSSTGILQDFLLNLK
tara:strand:- start:491 stop:637 length:147 start_codon:yes stop_codon:yes gene_type:complete